MKRRSPISKLVWWIQSGFNFNFWFEFEYRIHHTIKGDAFEWILGYLNASFEMTFLRENNHKALHSTSFSTRLDDPALGQMIRPNSAQWFGVSPDDPALGRMIRTWWFVGVQEKARPDDPALHRMIRTWEFQCVFSLFCHNPGWSGLLQKTHNGHFRGLEYIYPFTPFIYLSLTTRPTTPPKPSFLHFSPS